jgi:hypothetical protein
MGTLIIKQIRQQGKLHEMSLTNCGMKLIGCMRIEAVGKLSYGCKIVIFVDIKDNGKYL